MIHTDAQPITDSQALLDQLVADGLVVDGLTITEQGDDVWLLTATVAGGAIRRLVEPAPTTRSSGTRRPSACGSSCGTATVAPHNDFQ